MFGVCEGQRGGFRKGREVRDRRLPVAGDDDEAIGDGHEDRSVDPAAFHEEVAPRFVRQEKSIRGSAGVDLARQHRAGGRMYGNPVPGMLGFKSTHKFLRHLDERCRRKKRQLALRRLRRGASRQEQRREDEAPAGEAIMNSHSPRGS